MKSLLFPITAVLGDKFVNLLNFFFTSIINFQNRIYGAIIFCSAHAIKFILYLIDKDRLKYAEEVHRQSTISTEFKILANVLKVKEDALSKKVWTQNHAIALNNLATKLYHECDWQEDQIHGYMKEIVESIPGLIYVTSDEDDEDEDEENEGIPIS